MCAGLATQQWEVYESNAGSGDPIDGEMIGMGLTMAEAVCDAFPAVEWSKVFRRNGISSAV